MVVERDNLIFKFHHEYFSHDKYCKHSCSGDKKESKCNIKNRCNAKYDCCLMGDAINSYKDLLLKRVRGHYVGFKEIMSVYKKLMLVDVASMLTDFNINKCD